MRSETARAGRGGSERMAQRQIEMGQATLSRDRQSANRGSVDLSNVQHAEVLQAQCSAGGVRGRITGGRTPTILPTRQCAVQPHIPLSFVLTDSIKSQPALDRKSTR